MTAINGTNGNGKKTILGINFEPSISFGALLTLAGMGTGVMIFYNNQEHRQTIMEDRLASIEIKIQERIAARILVDAHTTEQINDITTRLIAQGFRIYRLELVVIPKEAGREVHP